MDKQTTESFKAALQAEEANMNQADERLRIARAQHELASGRFSAVRDVVKAKLYFSPYAKIPDNTFRAGLDGDKYRFVGMQPGDAAVELLNESDEPMQLLEIMVALRDGGLLTDGRTLNAALINRGGIRKDDEGRFYQLDSVIDDDGNEVWIEKGPMDLEPEDVPFE